MKHKLITGNEAAAWGMRLADVDYIPAFPITPQTEIIEKIAAWVEGGEIGARIVHMESEHSMLAAAGSAATTGVRVFSATSSQGLLFAMEMLYTVAGWRAPFVLVNVSRGLATPITLEADHNDIMAARSSGFLQLHCASCQEVLDGILLAYRLGEDPRVRLPVIVNLDGFTLSFTREPVALPSPEEVRAFLPAYSPGALKFGGDSPQAQATSVLGGSNYSYFRYQTHLAMQQGQQVFAEAARDFTQHFGRDWEAVECYRLEDAEFAFLILGAYATKAKAAVEGLRARGWKIGVIRPRLLRPFPAEDLLHALQGLWAVAVVDQNLSPGEGGMLYGEVNALLAQHRMQAPLIAGFIGGLGGRDISLAEFYEMAETLNTSAERDEAPPPRLLFTEEELEATQTLQGIALGNDSKLVH